jgi:hypothetical protein
MHAPQLRVQVSGPPSDLGRARLCPRGTLSGLLDVSKRRMESAAVYRSARSRSALRALAASSSSFN